MRISIDYPILRKPRLVMGVGLRTAVIIWGAVGIAVVTVGLPYGLLFIAPAFILHTGLIWFFKIDPSIFENYAAYATMPNSYRAGLPCDGEYAASRPDKFARGINF